MSSVRGIQGLAVIATVAAVGTLGWWITAAARTRNGGGAHDTARSIAGPSTSASPAAGRSRPSIVELAALALTEGRGLEDRNSSVNPQVTASEGPDTLADRRVLFALLRTGNDADALKAIQEFAKLGGAANCKQLAAIMKDEGWSDSVRTAAALALLKVGTPSDAVLSARTLGVIGDAVSTETLTNLLSNRTLPEALRLEAAQGLGAIGTPAAGAALIAAFESFTTADAHEQLLDTLGRFPFEQIEGTWKDFLSNPESPGALRAIAAEALANSSPAAVPFLRSLAESDRDPNVREEAAWALAVQGKNANLGNELVQMAMAEPEADVRRRLYEALLTQSENPAESLLSKIRNESDTAARVAGFNAVADAVRRNGISSLATEFDTSIVRELQQIALSPNTVNIRMRAVFALRRANTPASLQALQTISQTQNSKIAQAASNGLRISN